MIVVDTSALIAILLDEPERRSMIDVIVDYGQPCMSAASYLEASMVLEAYSGVQGGRDIDDFVEDVGVRIVPVDQAQARVAREAFRRFGKGRHRAGLNFGDCFVYALTKTVGAPILFKGNDFSLTDLKPAL